MFLSIYNDTFKNNIENNQWPGFEGNSLKYKKKIKIISFHLVPYISTLIGHFNFEHMKLYFTTF